MRYLKSIREFRKEQINESVDDLDLTANEIGIIEDKIEMEDDSETEDED